MSCHACMEPALPWRACFHAWGRWESVETLRHVRRSRSSWCESTEHMPEGRSSSGCGVGFMQSLLEDLWDREWQCHLCLWVYTVTPRHSGLIDLTLGNFKPYLPASTGRPSLWEVISSPLKIPCPTEKSPRFLFQKTLKLDSVMQGASCGQNPFDTRSILTEMEKNHLPKAIWRIQFSLVMNFTSLIWILNLSSSQRLMLP